MNIQAWDPLRALSVLRRHGVRFIVIGGYGGRLRGSASITNDTDVCYARDPENLERLAKALQELRAKLRGKGVPEDLPFILDAESLRKGGHFTFATDAGALDILGTPAGGEGFDELDRDSDDVDLDGVTVRVASVDALMRMKSAAGRPKDLSDLEVLAALREELDAQDHAGWAERKRRERTRQDPGEKTP
jgi:hypothetical protein